MQRQAIALGMLLKTRVMVFPLSDFPEMIFGAGQLFSSARN
jgi:hypothetical protein